MLMGWDGQLSVACVLQVRAWPRCERGRGERGKPQDGGGVGQGGGEGSTLQLQRDGQGQQVHHPDVWEHNQ